MADLKEGPANEFSYSNTWQFIMARVSISPRFEHLRRACLDDKKLNCKLISSNLSQADGSEYSYTSAFLDARLPHQQVEPFRKLALAPVGDEAPGDVQLTSTSTRADNIEGQNAEADRKTKQLASQRDRLLELSKRPNLSVQDTIQLEAEIARVQGELDAAQAAQGTAQDHLAREDVRVYLSEQPRSAIASVFGRASDILVRNVANALEFLIAAIPWLPIAAGAIVLASWLWRITRRKKKQISSD